MQLSLVEKMPPRVIKSCEEDTKSSWSQENIVVVCLKMDEKRGYFFNITPVTKEFGGRISTAFKFYCAQRVTQIILK